MNIEATAKQIMSAMQSDAFDEEACVKILRDNYYDVSCATCGEGAVQCVCPTFVPRIYRKLEKGEKPRKGDWHVTKDHILRPIKTNQTQPKPESWPEIARDAWEEITDLADTLEEVVCDLQGDTRFIRIILTAIERSHAAQSRICDQCSRRLEDGALYEDHAAQPITDERGCEIFDVPGCMHVEREKVTVRQHSDQPPAKATDDKPEEWTTHGCRIHIGDKRSLNVGSDYVAEQLVVAHKAELTAEHQRREQAERWLGELLAVIHCDGGHYQSEHGIEKATKDAIEKRYQLIARIDVLEHQLLSALAAIEKHNEEQRHNMLPYFVDDELDLSLLHEHDDEVRKPLVDGLNRLMALADVNCLPQARRAYDLALAKEKP